MNRNGAGMAVLALGLLVSQARGQQEAAQDSLPMPPQGKTWKLAWYDEFDGTKLDETKWIYRQEGRRRDGWWSRKAVSLDGEGHLVMSTFKDGDRYVDGCVATQGKFEHAFGYYVARIQLQKQPGHWSAFWLTCDGVRKIGNEGRDGSEIDIMEKPWLDDKINHAIHWDYGQPKSSAGARVNVPGVMDGFHTYSVFWTPAEYVFYVDGKETWRTKAGGVCQVPVYILLSDEIGKWAGDITKAKLPDRFLVDYVRVYDLVDVK
jgi:beta-glucanase (GH16 family)